MSKSKSKFFVGKAALKRFIDKDFWKHILNFTLAARRFFISPVILGTVSSVCLIVFVDILKSFNSGQPLDVKVFFPKAIMGMACSAAGALTFITAMSLFIWRIAIISRAYLKTNWEFSNPSRELIDASLEEAEKSLGAKKMNVLAHWLIISLIETPAMALAFGATMVLICTNPQIIALPSQMMGDYEGLKIPSMVVLVLSGLQVNNAMLVALAISVMLDRKLWSMVGRSLVLSISMTPAILLVMVPLSTIYSFILNPDLISQILMHMKDPAFTESVWLSLVRVGWEGICNIFLIPAYTFCLLELLRDVVVLEEV